MISVKRKVQFVRRERGRCAIMATKPARTNAPVGRVPRISRLMALAIRFDRLIRDGAVSDLSDLAQLSHVTQPRMTQIMNLNHLAPDIQEELLFLAPVKAGRERVHERMLRATAATAGWDEQRAAWRPRL